ncbi:MAG: transposase [Methanosarcinaceae archaeon]|nr:transposase [Methanosarcinaceae archaeon]
MPSICIIVEKVNPKNTFQLCSVCGKKKKSKLQLSDSLFDCERCNTSLDRNVNAAVNILNRSKTYQSTVRLTGTKGCGIRTSTTSCLTGLQAPTMNSQLLKLIRG